MPRAHACTSAPPPQWPSATMRAHAWPNGFSQPIVSTQWAAPFGQTCVSIPGLEALLAVFTMVRMSRLAPGAALPRRKLERATGTRQKNAEPALRLLLLLRLLVHSRHDTRSHERHWKPDPTDDPPASRPRPPVQPRRPLTSGVNTCRLHTTPPPHRQDLSCRAVAALSTLDAFRRSILPTGTRLTRFGKASGRRGARHN